MWLSCTQNTYTLLLNHTIHLRIPIDVDLLYLGGVDVGVRKRRVATRCKKVKRTCEEDKQANKGAYTRFFLLASAMVVLFVHVYVTVFRRTLCIYLCLCVHICIYVYIYIYINIHIYICRVLGFRNRMATW
ncbi:hypothetical protein BD289DRAFT_442340 [Coniella lustricola]|uniref:Transmembrane protein n=1 Tax=Coniella lustricola TaxID=2025994 RepID=A0A2T2ZY91_9PEZI|nr:hypothetical protein BD289DRAFT_442340 [Coniella lustricola]